MGFYVLVSLLMSTAAANNSIDIKRVGQTSVDVEYSCDASAGVVAITAMVGVSNTDHPLTTGKQSSVACDESRQSPVITLDGMCMLLGQSL